jgi:hypothetical protein
VTVQDVTPPIAVCTNITVQLGFSGSVSITASQINNGSSDACGILSMSVTPNTFTCANLGANPVTLGVVDVNGNSNFCNATVTVIQRPTTVVYTGPTTAQYGALVPLSAH